MLHCRTFLALILGSATALAVDISPSKRTVPEKFMDPPGKRFSLFSGDPERVQRANEVKIDEFSAEVFIEPKSISLADLKAAAEGASPDVLKLTFKVKNNDKKSYTLSFPDAQRYDIAVTRSDESLVYLWSDDKVFVPKVDSIFMNGGNTISFVENLTRETLKLINAPGVYKVQIILANYPEIHSSATFEVLP